MRDYEDAISARSPDWKSEAEGLMKSGVEFVVVHLKPQDYRDCSAMAKEFGYSECLEDDLPQSPDNPFTSPTRIGFVKHHLSPPKLGQWS